MEQFKIFVYNPYHEGMKYKEIIASDKRFCLTDDPSEADLALSYGGDGTLLALSGILHKNLNLSNTLIAGLNKGTVGFMANDMEEEEFITSILSEFMNYGVIIKHIQERTLFDVYAKYKVDVLALNEVSIHPVERGKLFVCNVCVTIPSMGINNECITYKGDGVIVATASGSTAYNLSAGGPILAPMADNIIITPIAPFSLADRTIILPSDTRVSIMTETEAELIVDGQTKGYTNTITVNKSVDTLSLYKKDNFLKTIQEKLGWNHSIK